MNSKSKGPLVLVVDDYADAREIYVLSLRHAGFRVAEAKDGVEALVKAFDLLPDIVLMDLALPNMDGWEATRRLKADDRTKAIPVVALTGHALPDHAKSAKDVGCDSFVIKPCLPDELVKEIHRVLRGARKTADQAERARLEKRPDADREKRPRGGPARERRSGKAS